MRPPLVISDADNVAIALEPIVGGQSLEIAGVRILARDAIPAGHKVARVDIPAGQPVIKYGSPIGLATTPIVAGDHVHTHNLASTRGRGDLPRDVQTEHRPGRGDPGTNRRSENG